MDFPIVEVFLLLVTILLLGNIGHTRDSPLVLEGIYTTGTKGFPPAIESMGCLAIDLKLNAVGVGLEV